MKILKRHEEFAHGKPVLLIVLDGVGVGRLDSFNAVNIAKTPVMDSLFKGPRYGTVKAHGKAVGLPSDADMGNSEVGHNTLGCGRVVSQGASLVENAFASGAIFQSDGYKHLQEAFLSPNKTLHLIGLLSDGGVHSHTKHWYSIISQAVLDGARRIRLHILLDGRDVPEGTSINYIQKLEDFIKLQNESHEVDIQIASGGGRMFVTMDRYEAEWAIVQRGWNAHVLGQADFTFSNAYQAVTELKASHKCSDQYIPPFCIYDPNQHPVGPIIDGDAVLCMNFRGDRVIEISRAFEEVNFDKFERKRHPQVNFAGMIRYDGDQNIPQKFLVDPPFIQNTSGEYLADMGLRVFACSETQKYGHVTYFWNGNRSGKFSETLETYHEIRSDTCYFAEKPEMKAREITDAATEALKSGQYDMVRINLPNGDMVGHTGELDATKRAVEVLDECLGQLLEAVQAVGGAYLITADHGNADDMTQRDAKGEPLRDENGEILPLTSHTLAAVPVVFGGPSVPENAIMRTDLNQPGLSNVTATFINLMGFHAPPDYDETLINLL
uniref:phosphoglycerate mutase (2,3-diphosphoglycerate-independent) n=1 Tax=Perkinsela sp. SMB-60 TaxID=1840652 RepID=A0A161HS49_9EUGL|nr:2,3-bisphosphoglycerate-independent phosphoglycerate mutase [Perkinsela sp. SMB-60]